MNSVIRSSAAARRWSPTSSIARSNRLRQAAVCVTRHTRSFMTFSSLHASSTVRRAPPRLEIGMTNEHTISSARREGKQTLAGLVFLQTVRRQGQAATPPAALHRRVARGVFPRNRSNAFHRLSTPSFGQCSALNCTHLKKFVPSGTQHHVHVVGTMLAPQDALSKLQACSKYLFTKQSLATGAAMCTLQVIWSQCPRRTPPTRSVQSTGWELYRYAFA